MHYFKPYNRELVIKALKKAGREDLIGWGKDCLSPPYEKYKNREPSRRTPPDGRREGKKRR